MPDLVLTHGYFLHEDPKEVQIMKPYAPLGILYICSHLRAKGHDVDVFDTTFSTREELFRYLRSTPPTLLGVYANLMTRRTVVQILQVAHECGWTTIVGGPEPGAYVEEYLNAGADVVVLGEGEETVEELLHVLPKQGDLAKVKGIAFRDQEGTTHRTVPREQIPNLDVQPWPARESIDMDRYVTTWRTAHGKGSVSFITARGCPYKCNWCSHQVFGQTHRRRNPVKVVDEVEWLLQRYEPEMVWVADDVFTIHHGWLRTYAAEMKKRSLRPAFECITRADRMTEEVVDLLAELGCFRVWIGSESGSQRILDAMERGVTVEEVQRGVEMARSRGIASGMFLMWGYEGEELQDIEATIAHVKKSDPDLFFTTIAYPIKGTPYHRQVSERLLQIQPWQQSSDRALRVNGGRPDQFYRIADQLLKDEVELARMERSGGSDGNDALRQRIAANREVLHATASEVKA